jgi:hypothetical protein
MAANVAFTEWSGRLVLNTLSQTTGQITKGTFTAGGSVLPSGGLFLALLTSAGIPSDDAGSGLAEFTSYSGGVRPAITFDTAITSTTTTAQRITAPATGTITYSITGSGTVGGIAICCVASTGTALNFSAASGNVLWYGDLTSTVGVVNTDVLTFNTDQIIIDLF